MAGGPSRNGPFETHCGVVQLLNDVMDVMSMEDVVVIKTRASLLLHDMLRNFPECGHVLSDDFEESTIPRELTESDLRDITKMTNVLGVVFKDHILTRRRMLNRKVDQFFKEPMWQSGVVDYRGDGLTTACALRSAIRQNPSFMGDRRQPPSDRIFKLNLGGQETEVFHFRSGFILRVDDHKQYRDLMDTFVTHLLEGKSIDDPQVDLIRGCLHLTARRMLWAGDSVVSFIDFDLPTTTSTNVLPMPIYHAKRWDVYSEYFSVNWKRSTQKLCRFKTFDNMRWDDIVLTTRGPVKRGVMEMDYAMYKMREQLKRRIVKAGVVNGFDETWILNFFLNKATGKIEPVESSTDPVKLLDSTNVFDDGGDYSSVKTHRRRAEVECSDSESSIPFEGTSRELHKITDSNDEEFHENETSSTSTAVQGVLHDDPSKKSTVTRECDKNTKNHTSVIDDVVRSTNEVVAEAEDAGGSQGVLHDEPSKKSRVIRERGKNAKNHTSAVDDVVRSTKEVVAEAEDAGGTSRTADKLVCPSTNDSIVPPIGRVGSNKRSQSLVRRSPRKTIKAKKSKTNITSTTDSSLSLKPNLQTSSRRGKKSTSKKVTSAAPVLTPFQQVTFSKTKRNEPDSVQHVEHNNAHEQTQETTRIRPEPSVVPEVTSDARRTRVKAVIDKEVGEFSEGFEQRFENLLATAATSSSSSDSD